ncbi:MAG TPA: neutral zinc metallopeptidase [Thermoanaerobaculia bacterium]|nr:neutral zinc metallopeptidase [Thermoanaerobaculia bacterium]
MRWTPGGESGDIEDRRGSSGGGFGFGGLHIGIGGAILLLVLSLLFHRNFFALLGNGSATTQQPAATRPVQETPAEHQEVQFVSFVLDDAQNVWAQKIPNYRHAKLVLFRDAIDSACGLAQTASGPFYCPDDEKIYLDLGFFEELRDRFGASGDFAQAYVIAHELGHHVQKLTGVFDQHDQRTDSVAIELQADCYAGIWGHSTAQRNILEKGDAEEGLNAAASVGDDRIQRMSGRAVNPETFTHGSSQQRLTWFRRGLDSGRIEDCDTFAAHVRQ